MAGLSVIIRKEISDAMSNTTFLLTVGILVISMVLTGIVSGDAYFKLIGSNYSWIRIIVISNLVPNIRILGALVAITFSFNSINKERAEGSLKVLLSYPIFRDQLILGKLIAGFILISLVTVVSMTMALSIYLFITNISLTMDLAIRFATVALLGILLLCVYLGLGMFFSIAMVDAKMTLLVMFLFLGLFNSEAFLSLGNIVTSVVYGHEMNYLGGPPWAYGDFLKPQARGLQVLFSNLNPSWGFTATSEDLGILMRPVFVNGGTVTNASGGLVMFSTNYWYTIMDDIISIMILAVIPILTFIGSYLLFTRRDVR